MKSVIVTSELYGSDTFGPYDTAQLADEAITRLKTAAEQQNDDVEREYSIVDAEDDGEDESDDSERR